MKKISNAILVAGCLVLLVVWNSPASAEMADEHQHHTHGHHHEEQTEGELIPSGEIIDGVRVVKMEAFQYGFKPDPLVVKAGEKVRLLVTSTDVIHGIMIRELGVNEKLPPGKVVTIEFNADKTGTFTIHCSIFCCPGHGKMHGSLIVQ